jgi:3-carboxy-cis,cis-muconate cycloisomerase
MNLLDPLFGSAEMDRVFSDTQRLQRMLDFEAALAAAEAEAGVVPKSAVAAIKAQCQASHFDLNQLAQKAGLAGNLAIPMVKELTELVASHDASAARYVHWGATSQDAIDTGLVLQLRDGLTILDRNLGRISSRLTHLVMQYRSTPIVGRTWMQHAVPIFLGLKFAGWLDALLRHRSRLRELRSRVLMLQFGGAAGSLAALGNQGRSISSVLAKELDLHLPALPWHSHRDRIAEIGAFLALISGTLGKIARDISLEMQTEISEFAESAGEGRGGSSTMPHKRNPVACSVILAAATRMPALASTLFSAMLQENERGLGGWQAEWETLPEMFRLTGGAVERLVDLVEVLEVHPDEMSRNLDRTRGLIFAEAVSMALAEKVGKVEAHRTLEAASRRAVSEGQHLRDLLLADREVTVHLRPDEIQRLFDPLACTGAADDFIQRVLDESRGWAQGEGS